MRVLLVVEPRSCPIAISQPSFPLCSVSCLCLTEMISDWELYSVHQELDPEIIRQKTAVAEGMVAWMKKLDLSPQEPIATDESTEAHDREKKRTHSHIDTSTQRNTHAIDVL